MYNDQSPAGAVSNLTPAIVFDAFSQVNQIPRPSKREGKMTEFLRRFGESLSLPTKVDEAGNVLISKPATPGCEAMPMIALQSHMDMVCEKNVDVVFDFDRDPIQTRVDGEWLRACGTTLGADDGIGVAMQMAILQSTDIEHGPIECLFTVDEETGLTGAEALVPGFLQSSMLINLDSEDEGEIFVSCAGGARTEARFDVTPEPIPSGQFGVRLTVSGLVGGHSGDDIDKGRANANKLLVRFLSQWLEDNPLHLVDIQAGGLHNAIPREATCLVAVPMALKESIRIAWNVFAADVEQEYASVEKTLHFDLESDNLDSTPLGCGMMIDDDTARRIVFSLQAVQNGVISMCHDIDLVETSTNLASIHLTSDIAGPTTQFQVIVNTSQRSSVASARDYISSVVRTTFQLAGAKAVTNEGYPGWAMNPNSHLLHVAKKTYRQLFNRDPKVRGIHAGLECGLFSEKYPGLDMISIGPTLRGVHSPDERLLIPTVDMVWRHLLAMLKAI